jgi:hypothetical protein
VLRFSIPAKLRIFCHQSWKHCLSVPTIFTRIEHLKLFRVKAFAGVF